MLDQSCPLVSIVISVYNGSNYMRTAIDSALAQTYANVEVLVINDGSADGGATHDIAMSYGDRIRYFQKENGGIVSALNFGIAHMQGELFSWLSHDDWYHPQKIERQVAALQKHNGERPAFCICNCIFVDENRAEFARSYVRENCAFQPPACFLFLGNVGFNGLMVLIPRQLFEQYGLFTPSLATHEYDMWLRIMAAADVVVEPECLTYMRMHRQQQTNTKQQDVHREIDAFLCAGIRDISDDAFAAYTLRQFDENGITYVFNLLRSYAWYQRYPETTLQVLEKIRRMFGRPSAAADFFYSRLFGPAALEASRDVWEYVSDGGTPLAVVYCERVTDETLKEMATGLMYLSARCRVVLLYHEMDAEKAKLLPEIPVSAFQVLNPTDFELPLYISLLCGIWSARCFWCVPCEGAARYEPLYHFLGMMEIGVVVTAGVAAAAAAPAAPQEFEQNKLPLVEPLMVTVRASLPARQRVGLHTVLEIPDAPLEAIVCWSRVFNVLLSGAPFGGLREQVNTRLADYLACEKAPDAEDVVAFVRDYMAQIDQRVNALRSEFEQKTFWKLTKPLRVTGWFFKKAFRAARRVWRREETLGALLSRFPSALKNRRTSL